MNYLRYVLFAGLLAFVVSANATTWVVNPEGTGDFSTIQDAIDSPSVLTGDTVELAHGTYTGVGNSNINCFGRSLTIRSQSGNPDSCILNCTIGRGFRFQSTSEESILEGITIRSGSADYGGGIYCYPGATTTVKNCIVRDCNASSGGGGVFLAAGSQPTFLNCTISHNTTFGGGSGLHAETSTTIINCTIVDNLGPFNELYGGILTMKNTIIGEAGILLENSQSIIEYCDIQNISFSGNDSTNGPPGIGVLVMRNANGDSCDIYSNIFADPLLEDPANYNLRLSDNSRCIGAGDPTDPPPTDIEGNPRPNPAGSNPDIGAYESELRFPGLCGSLSGTIGPGIFGVTCTLSVNIGDSLLFMPGTTIIFEGPYPFEINGTLLAEGTESDSIFFSTDTLSNPDRWGGVRFYDSTSSGSKLSFCRIEYGHASGSDPYNRGGGIYCGGSSPTFSNCLIAYNSANTIGGGICCVDSSSANFTNCTITGNTAVNRGGGVSCYESPLTFSNCTLHNNFSEKGGGIFCRSGSQANFTHCTITGNKSENSGGGVVCFSYASPTFSNCTISGNLANLNGSGIFCKEYSSPTLENTIVWGNCATVAGDEVYTDDASSSITFACSDVNSAGIEGLGSITWLSGNISYDPLFCNPESCTSAPTTAGDYTINDSSHCCSFYQPACGLIGALGAACNMIPDSVREVTITVEGADANVCWLPVDTTIYGNPVEADYYLVYFEEDLGEGFDFLAYTTDTCYTHFGVAQFSESMFYEVTAYLGSIGLLQSALAQLGEHPRRSELFKFLQCSPQLTR
ncbi:right-handed parallel beta-helix repeat-containing protein [bacterium]|nr:right-handed parallel beta-helix repeat-containing protein [bacterium]